MKLREFGPGGHLMQRAQDTATAAPAGCALTAALTRFWASHAAQAERLLHPEPLPAFVRASGASITHADLRRWMRMVQDALSPLPDTMRRGAWLVVALAVSPCSIEESALVLLAAERSDWVYVPVDVSLPPARQLELLRTARVNRIVALPQSPLARLLSESQASERHARSTLVAVAKPRLVVSESEMFQSVLVFALEHGSEPSLQAAVNESLLYRDSNAADEAAAAPAPLYVLFTSGSTGEPKGVLGTRAGAWNRMQWMWTRYPFDAGQERVVRTVKLTFVDSVWEILGAFLQHVPLVHVTDSITFSGGNSGFGDAFHVVLSEHYHFLERMFIHAVTRLTVVPSVLELLIVQKSRYELQSALASLRFLLISGETLPLKLALQISDKLPHVTVLNLYGACRSTISLGCIIAEVAY
jgi:non-ribosomal peptide synthetase component F